MTLPKIGRWVILLLAITVTVGMTTYHRYPPGWVWFMLCAFLMMECVVIPLWDNLTAVEDRKLEMLKWRSNRRKLIVREWLKSKPKSQYDT